MKKIGILYHPRVAATQDKAREIEEALKRRGTSTWVASAWDKENTAGQIQGTDLLLTIGGDGTVLRAIQAAMTHQVPVTGINLGKLGFMTELEADEALEKLPEIVSGRGWIDARAMLQAEAIISGQCQVFHALNDVVVARGTIARLVRIEASIDGQHLTDYRADGAIVATATGSTGYALAAGGPILYPQSADFLLLPVAVHLGLRYPLVLPSTAVVTLRLSTYLPATLSIDGHTNLNLADGDTVTIKTSPYNARFWRIRPRTTFPFLLEDKLKGTRLVPGRKSQDSGRTADTPAD